MPEFRVIGNAIELRGIAVMSLHADAPQTLLDEAREMIEGNLVSDRLAEETESYVASLEDSLACERDAAQDAEEGRDEAVAAIDRICEAIEDLAQKAKTAHARNLIGDALAIVRKEL